jgi:Zn finger protein HypA/HybF involved in hydrogenase expression
MLKEKAVKYLEFLASQKQCYVCKSESQLAKIDGKLLCGKCRGKMADMLKGQRHA